MNESLNSSTLDFLNRLGITDYLIIIAALIIMWLAPVIVRQLSDEKTDERMTLFRQRAIRGFAALVIALVGYYHYYRSGQAYNGLAIRMLSIMVVVYLGFLSANIMATFVRTRYGRKYSLAGRDRIADTYASRALSIFLSIFIGLIALISVVRIAGFDSLLEAGGVIGFIGVFLALTQSAWAPDIISGLIILNSKMLQERDVIKLSDANATFLGTVYRTRAFHTELLNLVDNHRVMIRNSRIRDYTVHNLSRFANARGLRETLKFKIGYDVSAERVRAMFDAAYAAAVADDEVLLEGQYPLEIRIADTGDHAIEWSVHYYTKDAVYLVKTGQLFRQKILEASIEAGISLSTPITHQAMPLDSASLS
ncbi:MAG: mechanosensitive ion channel family protein [Granulosicoccus sp.]|nr:mechanosensitive ion channel family protein [Granulosicoccus sp.]